MIGESPSRNKSKHDKEIKCSQSLPNISLHRVLKSKCTYKKLRASFHEIAHPLRRNSSHATRHPALNFKLIRVLGTFTYTSHHTN